MIQVGINLRFYAWKDDLFCGVASLIKYISEQNPKYAYTVYVDKEIEESCRLFFQDTPVKISGIPTLTRQNEYLEILKRDKINILQVYSRNATVAAMRLVPSVYVCSEIDELLYPRYYTFIRKYEKRKRERALVAAATEIVCETNLTLDYVNAALGKTQHCRMIFPAFNFRYAASCDESDLMRVKKKYDLPPAFILTVSDINRMHNARIIAKALRFTDCNWVLAGKADSYIGKVLKTVRHYGMQHRVRILTHADEADLPALYKLCSAVLMPFKGDNSLYPIANALYSHKPMIVSTALHYEPLLKESAYYASVGDIDGWADAISWLVSDEVLRDDLLRHYAAIKEQFSLERIGAAWMQLYDEMIKN